MYSKLTIFFIASAVLASPQVTTSSTTTTRNSCNVGTLQCCQQVADAHSSTSQTQAGLLGIQLGDITGQLGFNCNPISAVIGVGNGANCNANPVCCERSGFNGAVQIGCSSGNLNV